MADRAHIVIVSKAGPTWLGGRQYIHNLIRAAIGIRNQAADFDLSLLVTSRAELQHYQDLAPHLLHFGDVESFAEPYTLSSRVRWRIKRQFLDRAVPRLEEALARLGATFAYPFRSAVIPSADWIPDFQYRHFPEGSNPREIEERKADFADAVRRARRIVLSSRSAEKDCLELFPQAKGKTTVLRFRAFVPSEVLQGSPQAIIDRYHLPRSYLLVSNLLAPTKNHLTIVEALARLTAEQRRDIHVVWTGDIHDYRNPGFYNRVLATIHERGVRANISILGAIPKHHQMQLLRGASGYLQPSLFEGWNTGVEEAHLLGKPVLLSDISVHREQTPPATTFFDPVDPGDLAAKLLDFIAASRQPRVPSEVVPAYRALQDAFGREFLTMATTHV